MFISNEEDQQKMKNFTEQILPGLLEFSWTCLCHSFFKILIFKKENIKKGHAKCNVLVV